MFAVSLIWSRNNTTGHIYPCRRTSRIQICENSDSALSTAPKSFPFLVKANLAELHLNFQDSSHSTPMKIAYFIPLTTKSTPKLQQTQQKHQTSKTTQPVQLSSHKPKIQLSSSAKWNLLKKSHINNKKNTIFFLKTRFPDQIYVEKSSNSHSNPRNPTQNPNFDRSTSETRDSSQIQRYMIRFDFSRHVERRIPTSKPKERRNPVKKKKKSEICRSERGFVLTWRDSEQWRRWRSSIVAFSPPAQKP